MFFVNLQHSIINDKVIIKFDIRNKFVESFDNYILKPNTSDVDIIRNMIINDKECNHIKNIMHPRGNLWVIFNTETQTQWNNNIIQTLCYRFDLKGADQNMKEFIEKQLEYYCLPNNKHILINDTLHIPLYSVTCYRNPYGISIDYDKKIQNSLIIPSH